MFENLPFELLRWLLEEYAHSDNMYVQLTGPSNIFRIGFSMLVPLNQMLQCYHVHR